MQLRTREEQQRDERIAASAPLANAVSSFLTYVGIYSPEPGEKASSLRGNAVVVELAEALYENDPSRDLRNLVA